MKFFCPHCGQKLVCKEDEQGTVMGCPGCSNVITVPVMQPMQAQPMQSQPMPTQSMPAAEAPTQDVKKVATEINFSMLPVLMWILVGLQLGCFILLLCISLNTKSSPRAYEYQVQNFDRDERRSFNSRIADLANEGWEYVGVLTNNGINTKEVLFRRIKTGSSKSSEK